MPRKLVEENIVRILGIDALPDEEKIKLVERMANLVERRLILRLAEDLNDADMQELETLAGGHTEAAAALLRERFPNLDAMVREEIEAVKQDAVAAAGEVDKE